MASHPSFNHKLPLDLPAARVTRYWIGWEIILTFISLVLLISLPKTAPALLVIIVIAIIATLLTAAFLFLRYSFLPVVKEKKAIVNEKTKLANKIIKNQSKLAEIDRAIDSNQASEENEIEGALRKMHEEYIENGLRAEKIETADIPGVGPKLKERLKANRINTAADVGSHVQAIDGFGAAKVQAIENWKQSILLQLASTRPKKLPGSQLNEIQQKHGRQRDHLTKSRESYQLQHTALDLELNSINRNLQSFTGVDFVNFISNNLLKKVPSNFLQKNRKSLLYGILGFGALVHGLLGITSIVAVMITSKPAATITPDTQALVNTAIPQAIQTLPIPVNTNPPAPTNPPLPTFTPEPTRTFIPSSTAQPAKSGPLLVHFIDVGQGDSILIQAPDGSVSLIDGGEPGSGALQYLRSLGITHLDLVVATHPHSDHIGGLVDVLNTMPVDRVLTNGATHTTPIYAQFVDAIASSQAEYAEAQRGDTISLGDFVMNILSPVDNTGEDLNDSSLVLKLAYGEISFLFTGDAQQTAEEGLLLSDIAVNATILKIAHHASLTGSPLSFLTAVHPEVSIYSAGSGNDYGYPHPETIASIKSLGSTLYGTDVNGTIIVTTDGHNYSISTTRVAPTPTPTFLAPTAQPPSELFIDVISLTSPISAGGMASLSINTLPGAACTITVYFKSGPSQAAGLGGQTAGSDGTVTWTWKVGSRTTPGTWRIVVTANLNGQSEAIEIPFEVR